MVILMGPKGALVGAALEERRSMEKVFAVVECPEGEPKETRPSGFLVSPLTCGELVGSGPEGAGRTVELENCGLDGGTK